MTEAHPRVALIIPCFNDGETLPETLASLAGEEPHELVIVDDGSTERRTQSLLLELEDMGLRVLRTERAGPAKARMKAVAASTAPYVLPLDADDLLFEGAITALADMLDARPELSAVWGDHRDIGDSERYVRTVDVLDPWQESYVNSLPVVAMLRREALIAAGGWRIDGGWEDWDLWLSLAEQGVLGERIDRLVFRYRQRPGRVDRAARARSDKQFSVLRGLHPDLYSRRDELVEASPYRVARLWFELIEGLPALSRHRRLALFSMTLQTILERSPRPAFAIATEVLARRVSQVATVVRRHLAS